MKKLFFSALVALTMTGCATIISGTKQEVRITSYPSNAYVFDNGVNIGKTPFLANLVRRDSHIIRLELEGFYPYEVIMKKKLNAWYFGNILFGGLIGLVVDPITGAIHSLSPSEINNHFKEAKTTLRDGNTTIHVIMQENPEGELLGQLEKIND